MQQKDRILVVMHENVLMDRSCERVPNILHLTYFPFQLQRNPHYLIYRNQQAVCLTEELSHGEVG